MNQGKLVFAQIMEHLPLTTFRRCVARYDGEHKVKVNRAYKGALTENDVRAIVADIPKLLSED